MSHVVISSSQADGGGVVGGGGEGVRVFEPFTPVATPLFVWILHNIICRPMPV